MNNDEILQIINEAYEYCVKLYNGMGSVVINIKDRNLNELEEYFKNILEGFNWITEIIFSLRDFYNEKIELCIIEKKTKLLVEAYYNFDLLFFSDVIEYELMPQVEEFYNILGKLLGDFKH